VPCCLVLVTFFCQLHALPAPRRTVPNRNPNQPTSPLNRPAPQQPTTKQQHAPPPNCSASASASDSDSASYSASASTSPPPPPPPPPPLRLRLPSASCFSLRTSSSHLLPAPPPACTSSLHLLFPCFLAHSSSSLTRPLFHRYGKSGVDAVIASRDDPNFKWTVVDERNGEQRVLSERELLLIRRMQTGRFVHSEHNP
jgi:hypothetical protein